MNRTLRLSLGQYSDKGCKPLNQDFHGALIPKSPLLDTKGIVIALSDGISSSDVSQIASETAVKSFIEDYYSTSEAWSVKHSAQRVLEAINSWLYRQSRHGPHRFDLNRGYVCTFSALIIKSSTAYLFHIGDARICYLTGNRLETLTEEHRIWQDRNKSYLSRALGMREMLEIDHHSYTFECDDILLLMTDGIYEYVDDTTISSIIYKYTHNLDKAAQNIVETALENGSDDNLTIQIVRIDEVPEKNLNELNQEASELPFPPELGPRSSIDQYEIIRELHHSPRSHVYLAKQCASQQKVAIKVPSVELRDDLEYLERFLMEEWIAHRINSPHVIKPFASIEKRSALYSVNKYIEGQTLEQWMYDNPSPSLQVVRDIIEQIAKGLRAMHRQEIIHQDLRPANIMINHDGFVILIDLGSAKVAGIAEINPEECVQRILGTAQYTAPEYFLGKLGDKYSDQFSLGVIAYQMLTGELPYGTAVSKTSTRAAQRKLRYRTAQYNHQPLPSWIDGALQKATHPNPEKRYATLSEFIYDLKHPNSAFKNKQQMPLLERNPLMFWKTTSFLLLLIVLIQAYLSRT